MSDNTPADVKVAPLRGTLPPQCQSDVRNLRRYIHSLVAQERPLAAKSPTDFRAIFFTGANGFVGRFLLRELLIQQETLVVHCLIRAKDAQEGYVRLRTSMEDAEIWDEAFAPRIRVLTGDIGQEYLGLGEEEFGRLCHQMDAVYHLAADITLTTSYSAMRDANTLSLRTMLEMCLRHRFKPFFYMSTLAIFPQYFCNFANEFRNTTIEHQMQPDVASMKRIFPLGLSGYSWSKVTSEQILLYAREAGLPLAIFRLPRTDSASIGIIQANDFTVRMFAAITEVGAVPEGSILEWSNEPVDILSQICAAISLNPQRRYTIYNCCNPTRITHELEPPDFGVYWREVPYESFKQLCQAQGQKSHLHGYWPLVDYFKPYWFGRTKTRIVQPISDHALREDCPLPIHWPGLLTRMKNTTRWIEEHRELWPYPQPQTRLDYDCLMAQAEIYAREAGLSPAEVFPDWIREGLQQLVKALQAPEARLKPSSLSFVVMDLNRILRNNVLHAQQRYEHPEIEDEEIRQPVFIIGINRTGTTYLHRLLYRDERFWALRGYELIKPVLPPEVKPEVAGTPEDPRRIYLEDMLVASGFTEVFEGLHHVDIDEPEEEFGLLRQSFCSWAGTVRHNIPAYTRWLEATGSERAYINHRRALQVFNFQKRQQQGRQGQWLLKMPFHLIELEALIQAYPDALFIQTHREPVQVMGSWNSLVERMRSRTTEPQPLHEQGREQLAFMRYMMERAVDFRLAHPELEDRWVDVNYLDLVQDPLAIVQIIYDHFGWPLSQETEDRMDDWLYWQSQRRRKEKRHRYDLADYGLTPEAVNEAFAQYRQFITDKGIRSSRL